MRFLSVMALAALSACASDVPGPLTGHYEGTSEATVFSRPPGAPVEVVPQYPYRLDIRHTENYIDGTTESDTSRGRLYGTLSGARITGCTWSGGDGAPWAVTMSRRRGSIASSKDCRRLSR